MYTTVFVSEPLINALISHTGGESDAATDSRTGRDTRRKGQGAAPGSHFPKFLKENDSSIPRILFQLQCPCLAPFRKGR